MREQDKTPEKQVNELEIGNLPEKEFRIMTVKRSRTLGKNGGEGVEKREPSCTDGGNVN